MSRERSARGRGEGGGGPLRVLHVFHVMDRGGAETWMMHMLRNADRRRLAMDFLVHTERPGAYDAEILRLGGRILRCPVPSVRPVHYLARFARLLRAHGPYDVVHSHVHLFSGLSLLVARLVGVPVRIAHSHSDTAVIEAGASPRRRAYLALMRRLLASQATLGLACSAPAARDLFGPQWQRDPRWRLLYCGIDLAAFAPPCDREAVRARLGLAPDELVVGHVGRFVYPKNHPFLVRIAREVAALRPRMRLLLVGDGPLQADTEARVREAGLEGRTLFLGLRPDVASLMRGAMDVLLLPSHHEGLPLVGLEAQAAGLPALMSDVVTPELEVVPGLVRRLPLSSAPARWAEAAVQLAEARAQAGAGALARMQQSPFALAASLAGLEAAYGLAPRAGRAGAEPAAPGPDAPAVPPASVHPLASARGDDAWPALR